MANWFNRVTPAKGLPKMIQVGLLAIIFACGLLTTRAQTPSTSNYFLTTNNSGDLDSLRFVGDFARQIGLNTGWTQIFGPGTNADPAREGFFAGASAMITPTVASPQRPFQFRFMGVVYTQFNVSVQGGIGLGVPVASTDVIGAAGLGGVDKPVINAFELDINTAALRVDTSGSIRYKVVDDTLNPERVLVIEWRNMNVTNKSYSVKDATWQVRLHEKTGTIEFVYGKMQINNGLVTNNQLTIGFSTSPTNYFTVEIDTASFPRTNLYKGHTNYIHRNYYSNGIVRGLYEYDTTRHRVFRFTPYNPGRFFGALISPYLQPPVGPLRFTQVNPTAMRISWDAPTVNIPPAPNTGVLGYLVYRADGPGLPFVLEDSLPGINNTSLEVRGLDPATNYQWAVVSYSEGSLSDSIIGTGATPAFGKTLSARTGLGRWSDPTTWLDASGVNCFCTPSNFDNVRIPAGATVLIDSTAGQPYANCANLIIETNGVARFIDTTVGRTLYISGDLRININGLLEVDNPSVFAEIHEVVCARSIQVDGIMDLYRSSSAALARANMRFNSNANSLIKGFGELDFYKIIVEKARKTSVVEVDPSFFGFEIRGISGPAVPAFLTINRGTFRIRGVFAQASEVFDTLNSPPGFGYIIPSEGVFELQNPNFRVIRQNANANIYGTVTISNGVFEVGLNSTNGIRLYRGGVLNMNGDSIICSGRLVAAEERATYRQKGGIVLLATVGNNSADATFSFVPQSSNVNFEGGRIIIRVPSASPLGDYDVLSGSFANRPNLTTPGGTTLQLGDPFTPDVTSGTGPTFRIRGQYPNVFLHSPLPGFVNRNTICVPAGSAVICLGNLDINPRTEFNVNNCLFTIEGEYLNNYGSFLTPAQTSWIRFSGRVQQKYQSSISGSPVGVTPQPWRDLIVNNPNGLVLDAYGFQVPTRGVWFWAGSLINSHRLDIVTGTGIGPYVGSFNAVGNVIQNESRVMYGLPPDLDASLPGRTVGNFDVSPRFVFLSPAYYTGSPFYGAPYTQTPALQPGNVPNGTTYSVYYEQHIDQTNPTGQRTHITNWEIPPSDTINRLIVRNNNNVKIHNTKVLVWNTLVLDLGKLKTDSSGGKNEIVLLMNPVTAQQLVFNDFANTGTIDSTYVEGPLERRLQAGLTPSGPTDPNTLVFFPVGKSEFNPLWLMEVTTSPGGSTDVRVEQKDGRPAGEGVFPLLPAIATHPVASNTKTQKYWYCWAKPNYLENSPSDPTNLRAVRYKMYNPGAYTKTTRVAIWDTSVIVSSPLPGQFLPSVPFTARWTEGGREHLPLPPNPPASDPLEGDNRLRSFREFVSSYLFRINTSQDTLQRVMYITTGNVCAVNIRANVVRPIVNQPNTITPPRQVEAGDSIYATAAYYMCENEYLELNALSQCAPYYRYQWVSDTVPIGIPVVKIVQTFAADGTPYPEHGVMDSASYIAVRLNREAGFGGSCQPYQFRLQGIAGRVVVEDTIFMSFVPVPQVTFGTRPAPNTPVSIYTCSSAPLKIDGQIAQYAAPCIPGKDTVFTFTNVNVPITDYDTVYGVSSVVNVKDVPPGYLLTEVCLTVNHSMSGQVKLILEGPNGQQTLLVNDDLVNGAEQERDLYQNVCFREPGIPLPNQSPCQAPFPLIPNGLLLPDEEVGCGITGIGLEKYSSPIPVTNGTWKLRAYDVSPLPLLNAAGAVVAPGNDGLIVSWSLRFSRSAFDSLSYKWQNLDGTIPVELVDHTVLRPTFIPLSNPILTDFENRTMRLIVTDQRTGCQDTDTVAINIGRVMDMPAAQDPPALCGPGPVTLYAYAASQQNPYPGWVDSLVWFSDSVTMTPIPTNSFNSQILNLPLVQETDTFYVAQVSRKINAGPNGENLECVGLRRRVIVRVNPLPVPPVVFGPTIPLCAGPTASATLISKGASDFRGTYAWYDAPTGGNKLGVGDTFRTPVLNERRIFYVETISENCTSKTRTPFAVDVNVGVNAVLPPVVVSNPVICDGEFGTVTMANPNASGVITWYNTPIGGSVLNQGTSIATGRLMADTTFFVEIFDGVCASSRVPVRITVGRTPRPSANGDSIYWPPVPDFQTDNMYSISWNGEPAMQYSWDFGKDASPATSNQPGPIAVSWRTAGRKEVKVRVANIKGSHICEKTYMRTLDVAWPTAIDNKLGEGNSLQVYPNPTNNATELSITLARPQDVTIEVLDVLGKVVVREQVKVEARLSKQLELGRFGAGVYTVNVKAEEGMMSTKVVVQ